MSLSGLAQDSSRPAVSELRVNMINMRRALDAIVGGPDLHLRRHAALSALAA